GSAAACSDGSPAKCFSTINTSTNSSIHGRTFCAGVFRRCSPDRSSCLDGCWPAINLFLRNPFNYGKFHLAYLGSRIVSSMGGRSLLRCRPAAVVDCGVERHRRLRRRVPALVGG